MNEALTDNIVSDKDIIEKEENSIEVSEILNSIDRNVIRRVNVLSHNKSDVDDKFNISNNHLEIPSEFNIPKFRRSLPIIDRKSYFNKTQKWIGHVIEIEEGFFKAKLNDLTKSGTYEIGEFDLSEISEEDQPLIQEGSTFYWSIGYANEGGQVKKESIIRFQRLINWNESDYNEATDRASELSKNLKWD